MNLLKQESVLDTWDISEQELTSIVDMNPSMRGFMIGYIAEYKLKKMHFSDNIWKNVRKDDDHDRKKKGDLVFLYKDHKFRVECKSLQTNSIKYEKGVYTGNYQCDASDKRKVNLKNGETIETTCLLRGEFDLVAVNLFAFENKWRFAFALNKDLPQSKFKKYPLDIREQLLSTSMPISWPLQTPYKESPIPLLDYLISSHSSTG